MNVTLQEAESRSRQGVFSCTVSLLMVEEVEEVGHVIISGATFD